MLTFQQAYPAMYEFLEAELAMSGPHIDLRILLSELAVEANGTPADPGGILAFAASSPAVDAGRSAAQGACFVFGR
jgi:hypothetical protein